MQNVLKGIWLPFAWAFYVIGTLVLWAWWLITDGAPSAWKWLRGHQKAEGSLGSSDFADDRTLEKAGRFNPGGMLMMVSKSKKKVRADPEASIITVGQKGLGKTQSYIALLRDLENAPKVPVTINGATAMKPTYPDVVAYEPKGTVMRETRAHMERLGYRVMVIDIRDPDKSEWLFDALSILDPSDRFDYDRQLEALAKLISPSAVHGKHDHFESYPRIMIAGVIKHCLSEGRYSLPQCIARLIVSKADRERLFKEMSKSKDLIIQGAVEAFNSAGDREKGSFITTNFDKMKVWLRPSVRWMTEGSGLWDADDRQKLGWKWEDVFDDPKPVIVYIVGGLGTDEGHLVRLMVGNAINSARRRFVKTDSRPLRKPLWLLVDEAITLGQCDAVLHVNRELREARVCLAMWWLSLTDIKNTYSDWSTLLAGCDRIIYGNSGDMEWYELNEKLLGKKTIQTSGESESDYSKGKSRHEAARSLKNADELAVLPFEECIGVMRSKLGLLKVEGYKPFYIEDNQVKFY